MKTVILTGLRNEVDMRTGETTSFGLIFNEGALHIPVTQEIMEKVVAYAFAEGNGVSEDAPVSPANDDQGLREVPAEDDIPQM